MSVENADLMRLAVEAMIKKEVASEYNFKFEVVHEYENEFIVDFPDQESFNTIFIKVNGVDPNDLVFSDFSVNVYDDHYEDFKLYNWTVKELWKALLWR